MNTFKRTIYFITLALAGSSHAVTINQRGLGEVLIYPYYTVNNNYNTFYTIVNTTSEGKAIKVKFLEGQNSFVVLSFNVYLGAYDVWNGNLSSFTSSIPGHSGEPSVLHSTVDQSCSPFLNKAGQEFLPYEIDHDFLNNNLMRATEGHIEVIEMGNLTGSSYDAIDPTLTGIPAACHQVTGAWNGFGYWNADPTVDMLPASGGLSGTGTLLNIMEGTAVGYDAIALDDFWQGTEIHTSPGSLLPNIGSAFPQSLVLNDGVLTLSTWPSGIEAVSATLMQHKLYNEYDFTSFLAAKSEWVITFPTKHFHINGSGFQALPPFIQTWNGSEACEEHTVSIWDREEFEDISADFTTCYGVNVLEYLSPGSTPGATSQMLGSNNLISVLGIDDINATEAGWANITLDANAQNMTDSSDVKYSGLPAVGFKVQSYVNAAAPPGVLAIYNGLIPHKKEPKIGAVIDLIFANSYESP